MWQRLNRLSAGKGVCGDSIVSELRAVTRSASESFLLVHDLKKLVDAQAEEIRELRTEIQEIRKLRTEIQASRELRGQG